MYFIVVVNSTTIKLAATQGDALLATPITLDLTTAGNGIFSDVDALVTGAKWEYDSLRYTLTGGWLKATADTDTRIETNNIEGDNVTILVTGGNVGTDTGIEIIDISGGISTITSEIKVKLAATERDDAIIINPDDDTIAFGSAHNLNTGDAITFPGVWELTGLPASLRT